MTTTQQDASRNTEIARTIHSQIAIMTFATLGASNLHHEGADFVFNARIIPTGMSGARVMQVRVHLNGADLYDITVGYLRGRNLQWTEHYSATDVYAEDLNRVLFALDRMG